MIPQPLAWLFAFAAVGFWLLYKRSHDRAEAMERREKALHNTIALQSESLKLEQQRNETMQVAIRQQVERAALLVHLNQQLERQLSARDAGTIHLPVIGRIYIN